MLRALALAAVVVVAVSVGLGLVDEQREQVEAAVVEQAAAACNANLPGDGWTVANETVNTSRLDGVQDVLCTRNGTVERVSVNIEVTFSS